MHEGSYKNDINLNQVSPEKEDDGVSGSKMCRICQNDSSGSSSSSHSRGDMRLIAPCLCTGSLKYVHKHCLYRWIAMSSIKHCELCLFPFKMKIKFLPIKQWRPLHLNIDERRKLLLILLFQILATVTTSWATIYLTQRIFKFSHKLKLTWVSWIKCIAVIFGFIGLSLFTWVHLSVMKGLFYRWKANNQQVTIYPPSQNEITQSRTLRKQNTKLHTSNLQSAVRLQPANLTSQQCTVARKLFPNERAVAKSLIESQQTAATNQVDTLIIDGDYIADNPVESRILNRVCNENVLIQSSTDAKVVGAKTHCTAKVIDGTQTLMKSCSNISYSYGKHLGNVKGEKRRRNESMPSSYDTLSIPHSVNDKFKQDEENF